MLSHHELRFKTDPQRPKLFSFLLKCQLINGILKVQWLGSFQNDSLINLMILFSKNNGSCQHFIKKVDSVKHIFQIVFFKFQSRHPLPNPIHSLIMLLCRYGPTRGSIVLPGNLTSNLFFYALVTQKIQNISVLVTIKQIYTH